MGVGGKWYVGCEPIRRLDIDTQTSFLGGMFFRGVIYLLAGIALVFGAFPKLRGKRSRNPVSTDQKVWRFLLLISALLLIALGGRLLFFGLGASGG